MAMNVEAEIRDLKRRVSELEGSSEFLTQQIKGVPGAVQIARPADPAEQLQRPAADLGARPRRGQDAFGEGTRPVARVVGGKGDLGV